MSREEDRNELIRKLMDYLIANEGAECSKHKCTSSCLEYLEEHVTNSVNKYFNKTEDWIEEEVDECEHLQNSVVEILNYLGPSLVNVMIVYTANLFSFAKYFDHEMDVFDLFYEVAKFMVDNRNVYDGKKSICYRSVIDFYCKKFDEKKEAA